jgi:hypothetical protein
MAAFTPYGESKTLQTKMFPDSRNTFCMDPEWIVYGNPNINCQLAIHKITFSSPTVWALDAGEIREDPGSSTFLHEGVSWPTTTYAYFGAREIKCVRFDVQAPPASSLSQIYDSGDSSNSQEILGIQGDVLVLSKGDRYYVFGRVTGSPIKMLIISRMRTCLQLWPPWTTLTTGIPLFVLRVKEGGSGGSITTTPLELGIRSVIPSSPTLSRTSQTWGSSPWSQSHTILHSISGSTRSPTLL